MWSGMRRATVACSSVPLPKHRAGLLAQKGAHAAYASVRPPASALAGVGPAAERRWSSTTPNPVVQAVSNILYDIPEPEGDVRKHTMSVLCENEPGVLSRVSGLLSGRGHNIHSLTVCESEVPGLSRMTITLRAREYELEKAAAQLEDVEETLAVITYQPGSVIEREVLLMKLDTTVDDPTDVGSNRKTQEAIHSKRQVLMSLAQLFDAQIVDVGSRAMTLQLTSWPKRIDAFIRFCRPYGIIETARSGVVATVRSAVGSYEDNEFEAEEFMSVEDLPPS